MPEPGSVKAYDRFAYSNNNPINYTDPSGHFPESTSYVGDFLVGFIKEYLLVNNWIGDILFPDLANSLAPLTSDSNATIVGRIVADVLSIGKGISQITFGAGFASGGIVISCGTTACLAAAPAAAIGVAVATNGIAVVSLSSTSLGENLSKFSNKNQTAKNDQSTTSGLSGKILQNGGNTIKKSTYDALGLTRNEVRRAIEMLKKENGFSNFDHYKIMENGDYIGPNGKIGNIFDFVP